MSQKKRGKDEGDEDDEDGADEGEDDIGDEGEGGGDETLKVVRCSLPGLLLWCY